MKIRQFMVAVSALTLAGTFAMPAAAKGYAVCAFTATRVIVKSGVWPHSQAARFCC